MLKSNLFPLTLIVYRRLCTVCPLISRAKVSLFHCKFPLEACRNGAENGYEAKMEGEKDMDTVFDLTKQSYNLDKLVEVAGANNVGWM